MVTRTTEDKPAVPGRLPCCVPAVLIPLPFVPCQRESEEGWTSMMRFSSGRNGEIFWFGPDSSLPRLHVVGFCSISRGKVLWVTLLLFFIQKKEKKSEDKKLEVPLWTKAFPEMMTWIEILCFFLGQCCCSPAATICSLLVIQCDDSLYILYCEGNLEEDCQAKEPTCLCIENAQVLGVAPNLFKGKGNIWESS